MAVENVIAAMHERIDRPFSLDEMASIAYLSRFYFSRVFREVTGLPPVRFHTALRIAAAKRLLVTTELSVTEVCLAIGYQSVGTFATHFQELVGLSPRDLRRSATETGAPGVDHIGASATLDRRAEPLAVDGELTGVAEDALVFVGLFPQPCPHGPPVACTAVTGSAGYALRTATVGTYHVAAAAFADDDPGAGEPPARVAITRRPLLLAPGRSSRHDLRLRPVRRTDPPILLALPRTADLRALQFQGSDGHQPIPKAAGTLITQ
jgi:AraC family transcriptional regulator